MTALMRDNYGDGKQGVVVSVTQSHGQTIASHALGEITLYDGGAVVVGTSGKRYNYSSKNTIKALKHWESLGGIK